MNGECPTTDIPQTKIYFKKQNEKLIFFKKGGARKDCSPQKKI